MRSASRPTTCRSSTTTATRSRARRARRARPRHATPRSASARSSTRRASGPFEGYYNNAEATAKTTRFGWYWSGDLGYKDADGYLYFAGRNADWIRVDGENFPAGPIEEALRHAPGVVLAAVYGVPDDQAGDQVMAGLVLADDGAFDADGFAAWLDAQDAIGPKWRPRYVRVLRDPPTTGTNKIVKRTLVSAEVPPRSRRRRRPCTCGCAVSRRTGRSRTPTKRRCTTSFVRYQRERFWDL